MSGSSPTSVSPLPRGITILPNGKQLVSVSGIVEGRNNKLFHSGEIRLWDIASGDSKRINDVEACFHSVVASPNGEMIATGEDAPGVKIWRVNDGRLMNTLTGHTGRVESLCTSAIGNLLITVSYEDSFINVWRFDTGEHISILRGHTENLIGISVSSDGTRLASCSESGEVKVWDVTKLCEVRHSKCIIEGAMAVALSRNGKLLAVGKDSSQIELWTLSE